MDTPAGSRFRHQPQEIFIHYGTDNRTRGRIRSETGGRKTMEWLRRSAAPLSQKVWAEIDEIAGSMFKQTVVARRIIDFDGPRGWDHVATQLGTFKSALAPKPSGKARFSV